MTGAFIRNEHGTWCPSCGSLMTIDEEDWESCDCCGYPDDAEAMADYHGVEDKEPRP